MRIFVSGATGYIGRFLVRQLTQMGYSMATISRERQELKLEGLERIAYDGTAQSLEDSLGAWGPSAIVHLAANTSKDIAAKTVDGLLHSNLVFATHLLAAANRCNAKLFINISTFSTSQDGATYSPQTLYAATKKAFEDIALYYHRYEDIAVITLCFFDIYGPNQPHQRLLPSLLRAILENRPFAMTRGEQEICLLHVEDAVDAIVHCLRCEAPVAKEREQVFSVYGPEVFRVSDLPKVIASVLSAPCDQVTFERPYRKNEIMRFAPLHPALPGWTAKRRLLESLPSLLEGK